MRNFTRYLCAFISISVCTGALAHGAELTVGAIIGTVQTTAGAPVPDARVLAVSPSGRYTATSGPKGDFLILGVVPDTYTITAQATGYLAATDVEIVLPGERQEVSFKLRPQIKEIAHVEAKGEAFTVGSTSDVFTVTGEQARATSPVVNSSGLSQFSQGSVQGSIANVPGVQMDSFANVIVRGNKVQDTVYDYDSVPIPQGLIAEPGGNIVGAQLGTTGVGATTLTLAGYEDNSQNSIGGIVNQVPVIGTYPAQGTFEAGIGVGAQMNEVKFSEQWATPDLRWRYSLAATSGQQYFPYGDGTTFYPAEIGTYGLALQTRAASAWSGNVHFQPNQQNDFSATFLTGNAVYTQYDTPYQGLLWSTFNGSTTSFPGAPANENQQVTTPSIARGTYFVGKLQWLHNFAHSLVRFYTFESQIGAQANGPFWDDLSFPDGIISLASQQWQREYGTGFDWDDQAGDKNDLRAGFQYSVTMSYLDQVVPTADEFIFSNPRLNQNLFYLGDTWSIDDHLSVTGTLRYITQNVLTSDAFFYSNGAIDPHLGVAYTFDDNNGLRATFDHNSVAPLPLEVQRDDSTSPTPPIALSPETANDYSFSYEHGGPTQIRLTYYLQFNKNVIDVLPYNYRDITPENPSAVGVPTNAGLLQSRGVELFAQHGGLTLDAMYNHTLTSSVTQFAYNDLNPAAILAGHLYPNGYLPNFTATAAYEFDFFRRRFRVTPFLSYESGYPYGNGKMVWIQNPKTGQAELVPNDNYVNPGYNYYFLKNPALPFNAVTNPYIGNLGTNEGDDPNTLRTMPQTLASLHLEYDLNPRLTAIVDVVNLFATDSPTQYQGNPYLIGPPGYTGGDVYYEKAYGSQYCKGCLYTLGNGIPTNNGTTQVAPWDYTTAGYVPEGYPMGRTAQIRLRYRL